MEQSTSKKFHDCHSCIDRHNMCTHYSDDVWDNGCKHWRLGLCYTCKFNSDKITDDEWFARGCETWCFGGCRKYRPYFKKIIQEIKNKNLLCG